MSSGDGSAGQLRRPLRPQHSVRSALAFVAAVMTVHAVLVATRAHASTVCPLAYHLLGATDHGEDAATFWLLAIQDLDCSGTALIEVVVQGDSARITEHALQLAEAMLPD